MNIKYKEFENFDFDSNKQWKTFYKKISPQPSKSEILKYKKKFYKENIDPLFNINYNPEKEQVNKKENQKEENYHLSLEQTLNNYKSALSLCRPLNSIPMKLLEICSLFIFLGSLFYENNQHQYIIISFIIRCLNEIGLPRFDLDYLQALLMNDSFHTLIFSFQCLLDDFNYYTILPILISVIIALAEDIGFITKTKIKLITFVLRHKEDLYQDKAYIEIIISFLMLLGIYFKINTFKSPLIYSQLLRCKYMINPYTKIGFSQMNIIANKFKESRFCPGILELFISIIQEILNYAGNMFETKNEDKEDKKE